MNPHNRSARTGFAVLALSAAIVSTAGQAAANVSLDPAESVSTSTVSDAATTGSGDILSLSADAARNPILAALWKPFADAIELGFCGSAGCGRHS
ncbi:hypothetical protein [Nocardia sp. NBC_01327]|uniref:hypothetical protein n=1 Tax=Nocardia sp. NBC_01327 TaxID=2903593 RepID=UPI002E135F07|nr:hypothetical protein OG326_12625 [Nocardia sp. NBC_01327]